MQELFKTVNKKLNKLVQLKNLVFSTESDIVAITETWLTENVHDSEILGDEYSIFRRDRKTGTRGGGILLAFKNTLNSTSVFKDDESEILEVSLTTRKCNILFVLCYGPPTSSVSGFVDALNHHLAAACKNIKYMSFG